MLSSLIGCTCRFVPSERPSVATDTLVSIPTSTPLPTTNTLSPTNTLVQQRLTLNPTVTIIPTNTLTYSNRATCRMGFEPVLGSNYCHRVYGRQAKS